MLWLVALLALILLVKWTYERCTCTLPPGPTPIPVLGNLHLLTDAHKIHLTLTGLSKKYGDAFTIFMGSSPWVILNTQKVLKETFGKNGVAYSGRPQNGVMRYKEGLGIGFTEGELWRQQRLFTVTHLKELGFGKISFEENVKHELSFLTDTLEHLDGQVINIKPLIENAIANIMCQILFGQRYSHDDQDFKRVRNSFSEALANMSSAVVLVDLFPFITYLPGDVLKLQNTLQKMEIYKKFVIDHVAEHRKTFSRDNIRDFTDAYLMQMEEEKSEEIFSEKQCMGVLQDLFAGGFETTTSTLLSGLLHLILNPGIQQTLSQEIDDVLGWDKKPSFSDLKNMPYVEATLQEMLRLGNPLPLGVPHRVTQDVKLRDYTIPAGTTVISNLAALSLDESVYEDPNTFNPEHFLQNGNFVKPESFIPFGTGRRMCVGDIVAKMELFLFITSLLQRFSFRLPPGRPLPSTERKLGFTCCHLPYELIVESRNQNNNRI